MTPQPPLPPQPPPLRIALVDGGSFVLPYDWALAGALARRGAHVDFYGSATRYDAGFLDALRRTPGVLTRVEPVSGTVSPRWKGVWSYLRLLLGLWRRRAEYDIVNLQFSVLWPLDWLVGAAFGRRFVFTVHNAVPHGCTARQHAPTRRLARRAHRLVFVSAATRDDFLHRYGDGFAAKSTVLPHGVLPVAAGDAPVPYAAGEPRVAAGTRPALVFWGNVKRYKGVELFAELARDARIADRVAGLEVQGRWDPALTPLRRELVALGVVVVDAYLDAAALHALLARDAVFLLPYREASQSGVLYTLLHRGRVFVCADVGDLGDFMRRFGLGGLLMRDPSATSVAACLDHWARHRADLLRAFQAAQDACAWDRLLADAAPEAHGFLDGRPTRADRGR